MEYRCLWCGFVDKGKTMIVDKDRPYLWVCPKCSQFTNMGTQLMDTIKLPIDPVNSPSHYFFGDYQVIDVIRAWLEHNKPSEWESLLWGSMQQYLFRYKKKKGITDLEKAKWYLDKLIAENTEVR